MSDFDLSYELQKTLDYRRGVSERFPDDTRNYKAIDTIEMLMAQEPSNDGLQQLQIAINNYDTAHEGYSDDEAPRLEANVSASLGAIGFSWHPKDISDVVSAITTDAQIAAKDVLAARSA